MFPADELTASGGEIYCHLFENPQAGVPRNVYWSIRIDFHPIHYEGQDWRCSMTCEWLHGHYETGANCPGGHSISTMEIGDRRRASTCASTIWGSLHG